ESLTLTYTGDTPEDTAMGAANRSYLASGLTDWDISGTFRQDFAAAKVDATLFSIVATSVTTTLKPTSGAISATNPSFAGSTILDSYNPIDGSVGDSHTVPFSLKGTGALTRATS
ncbi:MAG: radical SAM protein, partial [Acidimicrobiia bacterium]